jgi:hypothetical protein
MRERQIAECARTNKNTTASPQARPLTKTRNIEKNYPSELEREPSDRYSSGGLGRKQIDLQLLPLFLRSFSNMYSLQQSNLPG